MAAVQARAFSVCRGAIPFKNQALLLIVAVRRFFASVLRFQRSLVCFISQLIEPAFSLAKAGWLRSTLLLAAVHRVARPRPQGRGGGAGRLAFPQLQTGRAAGGRV